MIYLTIINTLPVKKKMKNAFYENHIFTRFNLPIQYTLNKMKSCFVKRLSSSSGLWPPTGLFYMSLSSLWRGHSGRTPWMDNFAWWRTRLHYWTYLRIFHLRIIWMRERRICRKRMQAGFHYGHLLYFGLFSSFTYVSLPLEKGRYQI